MHEHKQMTTWETKGSNINNANQRAFSSYSFKQEKHIVEIKNMYNILIVYVHKTITKLKSLIWSLWLAMSKKDP